VGGSVAWVLADATSVDAMVGSGALLVGDVRLAQLLLFAGWMPAVQL
jgi:hypothetical protein